jgi:hypothetical protein
MAGTERFEQLIAFLGSHLPEPVEQQPDGTGGIVFTGGSPGEVIAHLTDSVVVIAEFRVRWENPGTPVVNARRVGVLKWRRLPETPLMNAIASLIKGAREMRLARYRMCLYCGTSNPPEWLQSEGLCRTCAAQGPGTVYPDPETVH